MRHGDLGLKLPWIRIQAESSDSLQLKHAEEETRLRPDEL